MLLLLICLATSSEAQDTGQIDTTIPVNSEGWREAVNPNPLPGTPAPNCPTETARVDVSNDDLLTLFPLRSNAAVAHLNATAYQLGDVVKVSLNIDQNSVLVLKHESTVALSAASTADPCAAKLSHRFLLSSAVVSELRKAPSELHLEVSTFDGRVTIANSKTIEVK